MDGMNSMEPADLSAIDQDTFNGLREVVGDGGLTGLIGMYQDESEQMIADIEAAMEAGDLQALERHVHLLKGVSSNFGLDRVVAKANAAMAACRDGRGDDAHSIATELPALAREAQSALKEIAGTLA